MDLSANRLFAGIKENDCQRMIRCFDTVSRSYRPGAQILDFEDGVGKIGLILSGRISVVRYFPGGGYALLESLEQGDVFGDMAGVRVSEDVLVRADTACSVLLIPHSQIVKRCKNACVCHSVLVENLLRLISEKTARLGQRVEVLSRRSIRDKLLCYFSLLAAKNKSRSFLLPFSVSALADYLCVDRSAMTREISRMKAEGLLNMDRRHVTLAADGAGKESAHSGDV